MSIVFSFTSRYVPYCCQEGVPHNIASQHQQYSARTVPRTTMKRHQRHIQPSSATYTINSTPRLYKMKLTNNTKNLLDTLKSNKKQTIEWYKFHSGAHIIQCFTAFLIFPMKNLMLISLCWESMKMTSGHPAHMSFLDLAHHKDSKNAKNASMRPKLTFPNLN